MSDLAAMSDPPDKPVVGRYVSHAGKLRQVLFVQDFGGVRRVWVEYDARNERSGYDGYYEVRIP